MRILLYITIDWYRNKGSLHLLTPLTHLTHLTPLKIWHPWKVMIRLLWMAIFFIEYSLAIEFIIKLDLTLGEITREVVFHIECVTWCFIYGKCKLYYFDSQFNTNSFPQLFRIPFFNSWAIIMRGVVWFRVCDEMRPMSPLCNVLSREIRLHV